LFDCRSKLASVRLQDYWNKVCEDEKRSRLRNEQLLREFDDLEMKAKQLGERIAELTAVNVCVELCRFTLICCYFVLISIGVGMGGKLGQLPPQPSPDWVRRFSHIC